MKNTHKLKKRLAIAFLSLGSLMNADAANLYCTGKISRVYSSNTGDVYFFTSWRNDYVFTCNMNSTVNNISPSVCKGWYAGALAAAQAQVNTILFFPNANIASCDAMPTYNDALPVGYFMYMAN